MKRDKNNNIWHYKLGLPVSLAESKRPSRRRAGVVLGTVLVVVVVLVRIISSPAHGHRVAVDVKFQPKPTVPQTPQLPAQGLQSSYFQLNLPAGYQMQSGATADGYLYQQTLIKPSAFGSLILNIGIKLLPADGLAADADYNLRLQSPSQFHLSTETVNGDSVHLANDSLSSAVVAFWPHGSYLATISVRSGLANPDGSDNSDELAALQPLLQAFHWR